MTVNERVCRNVKALCKINHVQLAEVENKLGKHPGFPQEDRKLHLT